MENSIQNIVEEFKKSLAIAFSRLSVADMINAISATSQAHPAPAATRPTATKPTPAKRKARPAKRKARTAAAVAGPSVFGFDGEQAEAAEVEQEEPVDLSHAVLSAVADAGPGGIKATKIIANGGKRMDIYRALEALVAAGRVERHGRANGTKYVLVEDDAEDNSDSNDEAIA